MKVWMLGLCLSLSTPAWAGGAIGGSTGSKCAELIIMNVQEFQRLVHDALTKGQVNVRGAAMHVEALDLDERTIEMRSLDDADIRITWIVEVREQSSQESSD